MLGFVLLHQGQAEEAADQLNRALALAEHIGHALLQLQCRTYLAVAKRRSGHPDRVKELIETCLQAASEQRRPEYAGVARANDAWLHWLAGDFVATVEHASEALACWRLIATDYPFEWLALWPLLGASLSLGRLQDALAAARSLLGPYLQSPADDVREHLTWALQAWDDRCPGAAEDHLRQALAAAQAGRYL